MSSGGRRRRGKAISGVLVLDKPLGWTSGLAVSRIKRLFDARKVGHTGSLDQLATGVLPLCFGEATKLSGFLLDSDKHYEVRIRLGVRTDSGDAEGKVLRSVALDAFSIDEAKIDAALDQFRGSIDQVPPMYSAVKREGQPLYKLARKGIEVEREPRPVEIFRNEITHFDGQDVSLRIECSKGTYIRTIADDLGELLGCGAHVIELRRTKAGPFGIAECVLFDDLKVRKAEGAEMLLREIRPSACAVQAFPRVDLTNAGLWHVRHGQPVMVPRAPSEGWVRLHEDGLGDNGFVGVGEVLDDGRIAPRRMIAGGPAS